MRAPSAQSDHTPSPEKRATASDLGPWVEFPGLDWEGYLRMMKLRGDRSYPRMAYLDGTVYLMSPAYPHELLAERFGLFVMEVAIGLRIPFIPSGRTTFRRRPKRGGVEGDKTFYIANEARIRGKTVIDLKVDPPPDLAIEAVNTHGPAGAIRVYQRLGVPEVWTGDIHEVVFLVLGPDGRYTRTETSLAFPFLTANEIADWIHRPRDESELEWAIALRQWITEVLAPRLQAK